MDMKKDDELTVITFDKCPHCGSKDRLAERLAKEAKARGFIKKDISLHTLQAGGRILDKRLEHKVLLGAKIPAFRVFFDVCLGYPEKPCGILYATKIEIFRVVKTLVPPKIKRAPDIPFTKG